ncbi:reverse transcriptase [Tanacetum coccineum]
MPLEEIRTYFQAEDHMPISEGLMLSNEKHLVSQAYTLMPISGRAYGADNAAADALSRLTTSVELNAMVLSSIEPELLQEVKASWETNIYVQLLIQKLETQIVPNKKFSWNNRELRRKGVQVSLKKLASLFYWKGMSKAVKMFVRQCDVCQRKKPNLEAYPCLLQPLHVPINIWKDTFMDFIDGLPSSQGKTFIFVVVDRLIGTSNVDLVDRTLAVREEVISVLKFHLRRAQDRMKAIADGYRTNRLIAMEPEKILDIRLQKKGHSATVYVLVQQANSSIEDATWEWTEDLQRRFPQFKVDA